MALSGRLARSQNESPAFEQLGQVFGVDRSLPPPATGFVKAKAGVFAPASIEEVDAPVRERGPYQSGKRIDDAAERVLHSGPSWTVAVTRGCATLRANVDHTLVSVCGRCQHHLPRAGNNSCVHLSIVVQD
jgi:hypothetical protein